MNIGIDIVKISRFENKDIHFIKRVLTEKELLVYNNLLEEKKAQYLASRWASKEAIYKANKDEHYLSFSILNKDNGEPYVDGHEEIKISISHDGEYAVASVLIC